MKIIQKSSFIIAIIILVSSCFIFSANASSLDIYDNFEYTIVNEKNKTCEIDEINVRKCDFLEIPAKMDGYTVVSLRDEVFQDISHPEIKAIKIPSTIKEIPEWCFSGMDTLETIILEEGLTKIGERAFARTGITEIDIPSTVTVIDCEAFISCKKLKKISLPKKIQKLGHSAFSSCESLEEIVLPENLTSIESFLFEDCSSLKEIEIPETVTYIDPFAFKDCSKLSYVEIPSSVKTIDEYAFSGTGLIKVTIPGTVTNIGDNCFYNCEFLEYVYIEEGVSQIGEDVFSYCDSLKYISVPDSLIYEYYFWSSRTPVKIHANPGSFTDIEFNDDPDYEPHSYSKTIVEPTCGQGYTIFTCECGYSYKGVYTEPIFSEHSMEYVDFSAASTKTAGNTYGSSCSVCSAVFEESKEIPMAIVTLSNSKLTYTGKTKKPSVIVKDKYDNIISSDNYDITYPSKSIQVGKYSLTVTFKNNYTGKTKLYYYILPKATSISRITRLPNALKITWKQQKTNITGYQVEYSLKSDFTDYKISTISKSTTTSKTIKDLKAGKTYYIRIRTYKTEDVNGKKIKYYSPWTDTYKLKVANQASSITPQRSKIPSALQYVYGSKYQVALEDEIGLFVTLKSPAKDFYPYRIYVYRATSSKGEYKKVKTVTNPKFETNFFIDDSKVESNKAYYYKLMVVYTPTDCTNSTDYNRLRADEKIFDEISKVEKFWTAPKTHWYLQRKSSSLTWPAQKGATGYFVQERAVKLQGYNIWGLPIFYIVESNFISKTNTAKSKSLKEPDMRGSSSSLNVTPYVIRDGYYYAHCYDIKKSHNFKTSYSYYSEVG